MEDLYPLRKKREAEQTEGMMNTRRFNRSGQEQRFPTTISIADRSALREEDFLHILGHERKRAERTQKPCLLMLVEMESHFSGGSDRKGLGTILAALSAATRETDVTGWYQNNTVVGVLFTEIAPEDGASIVTKVMTRVSDALRASLSPMQFNQAMVSFHLIPGEHEEMPAAANPALYPDLGVLADGARLVER